MEAICSIARHTHSLPLIISGSQWRRISCQDEDVLEDFGYNNVFGIDSNFLLGVYRGLYLSDRFSAEDIHEWRIGRHPGRYDQGVLLQHSREFPWAILWRLDTGSGLIEPCFED
jgi:hypothetical protein